MRQPGSYNIIMEIKYIYDPEQVNDGYRLLEEYLARVYLRKKTKTKAVTLSSRLPHLNIFYHYHLWFLTSF